MILYMGKLTRSHLRLSSLGNATYSWMSGKFTDLQISILCHHIVSTKFPFEFHIQNQKSSKYVHSLLRNNSTKMQANKTTYIGVPKLFANSNKRIGLRVCSNNRGNAMRTIMSANVYCRHPSFLLFLPHHSCPCCSPMHGIP